MDEELYRRFLNGDPAAITGVRNHMRAIATRVLSAPQWGMEDGPARREQERSIAAKAMASPAENVVGAATEVMRIATAMGLKEIRRREVLTQDHPDVELMACHVLQILGDSARAEIEEHLNQCPTCFRHVTSAGAALRTAVSAQPTSQPKPKAFQKPEQAPTPRRPRQAPPPRRKRPDLSALTQILPLVALVVGMTAYWWQRQPDSHVLLQAKIAHMLPAELPPSARAWELKGTAKEAVKALGQGRCDYTARRLGIANQKNPDNVLIQYYLGLAHVCLRDGPKARKSLSWVKEEAEAPPFGLAWWLAQAQLLDGGIDEGLATLDSLAKREHPRAAYARELAQQIRSEL